MDKNNQTTYKGLSDYMRKINRFPEKDFSVGYDGQEVIATTKSKEDFERILLQKRQRAYLEKQWKKITPLIYNQSLVFEAQRIPAYFDYDMMEYYPIIGAALDVMMEESTLPNEKGEILTIYSESKRVKKELDNLFENNLNIRLNLPMWTRNMCKYGDDFVYLDVHDELGVVGCRQLPNIEIERLDGDIFSHVKGINSELKDGETVFRWKSTNVAEFKDWQIAHFRLLIDDRRLPYGVSVLEKARRVWKNLLLVEDAMRTILLIRAVDRKVYSIDVGSMDPQDVPAYIDEIGSRFRRKKHINPETGQEDLKYYVASIDQDIFIPKRGSNDGSKVENLEGQSSFNTDPINYDLSQLFAALRVPKAFLNYDEVTGDGKNLAMQDIRFARTIARIQQAMLQELNKIAIIHLVARGLQDEVANFQLRLNNPSLQQEIMRLEMLQQKISAYRDAVSDAGNGFGAMSMTKAKAEILGMTNEEILLDVQQQRIEKAASFEMDKTEQIIPNSGVFDKVDAIYGDPTYDPSSEAEGGDTESGGADLGGGGGGGSFGGSLDDLAGGDVGDTDLDTNDLNDELGGEETEGAADETPDENPQENIQSSKAILTEYKWQHTLNRINKILDKK